MMDMRETPEIPETHVDDLIDAFVLGALEPEEVAAVDLHVEGCARCRALLAQARASADLLLLAAPQVATPPALRVRVLARVRAEAASARAAGDAARDVVRAVPGGEADEDAADLAGELLRDLLAEPDCVIVNVPGTEHAAGASARFVGARSRREGVLLTAGLGPLAADKAYQVWFLRGGEPQPNALFAIDPHGHGASVVRTSEPLLDFDTLAVTPEPLTGSAGPTGPVVLAGELGEASAPGEQATRMADAEAETAEPRASVGGFLRGLFGRRAERDVTGELLRDLLAEPDCVIVNVPGTAQGRDAHARFISARSRHDGVLVSAGLARLAPDRAYQVWLLREGQPQPNTLFALDAHGHGASVVHAAEPPLDFDTLAVTPEPAGGSPSPTGPIVLAGALHTPEH
ncbi:MAG: hypothetical protein OJF49_002330 [Ktedonobacterales bacterium]|jgi:anti-sigma-K factor RskA|nr:MAG: hypothetical protein OJF49_002330 [Ktedonobacterales bacterium]